MSLRELLGQPSALAVLSSALEKGELHHALRFEGPPGVGKELAAFGVAMASACTSDDPLGCGHCEGCRRAVTFAEGPPAVPIHPDIVLIERGRYADLLRDGGRKIEERTEISIQQVRQIIQPQVTYSASEAKRRIFIIRRAEEMSIGAANALLKTLEEPRPGNHFILLTSRPDSLLPTIRSRTMPIRFAPLPGSVMRTLLTKNGVEESRHDELVDLAQGSIEAALELAGAESAGEKSTFVKAIEKAICIGTPGAATQFAESAPSDRHNCRQALIGYAAHLARRSRTLLQNGGNPDDARRAAEGYSHLLRVLADMEEFNGSPAMQLGALVLELAERGVVPPEERAAAVGRAR